MEGVSRKSVSAAKAQPAAKRLHESDLGIMPNLGPGNGLNGASDDDIILRIECITDRQMKLALRIAYAANVLAFVAVFTEFGIKFQIPYEDYSQPGKVASRVNMAVGAVGLVLLLWIAAIWAKRVCSSLHRGKCWKHRRRRISMLVMAELGFQIINLAFYIIPNAVLAAAPCSGVFKWLVGACAGVRWTCWDTLFMLICVHAHNFSSWQPPGAADANSPESSALPSSAARAETLILDGPWTLHWTKLILWLATFVVVMAGASYSAVGDWIKVDGGGPAANGRSATACGSPNAAARHFKCTPTGPVQAIFALLIGLSFAWFLLWLFLIYRSKWELHNLPYADHKVANLFLRLQERGRWVFIVAFSLSLALLWYARVDACVSSLFTWLGLLPMQILATLNIGSWAYMMMPISANQQAPILQMKLQQFAWTMEQHTQVQKEEETAGQKDHTIGNLPPLFCMERAFAGLYWSGLVYDSHEAEGWEAKMGWGYELLGLEAHELIWEHSLDTKALLGWGAGGITIAFRGTASLRNALSDLQVWRIPHPPLRGVPYWSRPTVHHGFLRAWLKDRLDKRVVSRCLDLAAAWSAAHPGQSVPILITGHSLGGALGVLAAYDIAKAAAAAGQDVSLACYTFGAPRVGSHLFAADHEAVVPDTWSIVNDQDIVARRGKFWVLYKRSGHRVIINMRGDLIVRPSFAEANVQRIPGGGSVQQHYMGSYQQALLAVCLAQFSEKRYHEGMEGVLALSLAARPLAALFQQGLGLSSEDMAELARASHASPEKWKVRRKQMRAQNSASEAWRNAAMASPIMPSLLIAAGPSAAISDSSSIETLLSSLKPFK